MCLYQQGHRKSPWQIHIGIKMVRRIKRAKVKPLNYSQVTVVQDPEENPLTFLQHLKDAIRKHTTVDPES
jgi:hypothetical protein